MVYNILRRVTVTCLISYCFITISKSYGIPQYMTHRLQLDLSGKGSDKETFYLHFDLKPSDDVGEIALRTCERYDILSRIHRYENGRVISDPHRENLSENTCMAIMDEVILRVMHVNLH